MTGPHQDGAGTRPSITIREGRTDELEAIAAVFLACWRTSYQGWLPAPVITMYDEAGAQALWRRSLARAAATDGAVLVADHPDHGIVGVIRIGRDPDDPTRGHVSSLYVHPAAQGLGVGKRLLEAADVRFRADGVRAATLWVFEANADARGFYARQGWHADGIVRVEPDYGEPELHLVRSIPTAAGGQAGTTGPGPGDGSAKRAP